MITTDQKYNLGFNLGHLSFNSLTNLKGFNGMEKDDELKGSGNHYDYGFRVYDPRIARFLSVDPLYKEYPWYTPYQYAGNKPIKFIDRDGLEEAEPEEYFHALLNPIDAIYVRSNSTTAFQMAQNSGLPNPRDGQQDAFRHTIWNAMNAADIGGNEAKGFADNHETSADSYDKNSPSYDPVATEMDFWNNHVGRRIGEANSDATDAEMATLVNQAMANGELKMIKMSNFALNLGVDANGNAVTQNVELAVDKNGNPIIDKSNAQMSTLLTSSGYTVNTNLADKQLIKSTHPTVAPNNTTVPEADGYGNTEYIGTGDSYDKTEDQQTY